MSVATLTHCKGLIRLFRVYRRGLGVQGFGWPSAEQHLRNVEREHSKSAPRKHGVLKAVQELLALPGCRCPLWLLTMNEEYFENKSARK